MKTSEFKEHVIFEKLGQLETRVHDKESAEKVDIENLDFLKASCSFIRNQLDKSLTILINIVDLTTVANELDGALTNLNAFLGDNSNLGHLNNASNNLYSAISKARSFPVPNADGNFSFSQIINDFKSLVDQKLKEFNASAQAIDSTIGVINQNLKERQEGIDTVNKIIGEKQLLVDSLNTTFQSGFDQIKSTEATKFEELRNNFKKDVDNSIKAIDDSTKDLIGRLNTKETEAKKLVNVIGNVGATGNYQQVADANRKAANLWRNIAIGFMSLLAGILVYTIWKIDTKEYDWQMALVRILSALVLTYPATYAARESSKHRQLESINRRAELELASINPFIEILDDAKKQEIKEKLVEKYFGNNERSSEKDSDKSDEVSINIVERIIKTISSEFFKK
ncbi:MAG: hypothetical protein JNM57_06165 [Cyclobacteriaceae bacterium]|nr:hypothetical protein [Cyclobacteriaceae bacterium]